MQLVLMCKCLSFSQGQVQNVRGQVQNYLGAVANSEGTVYNQVR